MSTDVASELAGTVPQLENDWRTTQDELDLPYVALGFLAGRIVELDQIDPNPDWKPLFAEVERRLRGADPSTRELLIVGFLEGLQNVSGNRGHDPARWEPLLGPLTRDAWTVLNDMWNLKVPPGSFNEFGSRDIRRR
jgi:hypothetical protein